jgi:hypothetical protein
MSTKIRSNYPPAKKKFKGLRGIIAEQRDFRGGSATGDYIDTRLANELEKLLNERDAMKREYFLLWDDDNSLWLGPISDEESVDRILEDKVALGHKLHKASRLVGEIK